MRDGSPPPRSQVHIAAAGIKSLVIEKCDTEDANNFQMVVGPINLGSEASAQRPELVEKEIKLTGTRGRHFKFVIKEGWSDFCAVYRVSLNATA